LEDRVEGVVCLDVVHDSVEPLGVVMANVDKLLLAFKVKSPHVTVPRDRGSK
jgi:hypothetical protein